MTCTFFECVGVAASLFVVGFIARMAYQTFVYKCDLAQFQTKKNDAWALVTGCTSGIGEGFAHVLAQRGFNVLLVSRSEAKLRELAATLKAKYPSVKTAHVVSDAASLEPSQIDDVVSAASAVPLTMLINNVGVIPVHWEKFERTAVSDIESMITVNTRYSTLLTQKLIPILRKNGRAAIVNLSSESATMHPPNVAVYGATKAYNLAFSNAIRDELAADNIEVLALTPGFVATPMTRMKQGMEVCSAEACAEAGLNAIGLRSHAGYWYHHLFLKAVLLLPASVRGPMALKAMAAHAARRQKKNEAEHSS